MSLPDADEFDLPEGPALWECKNAGCAAVKPKTEITETQRKTLYRCPQCSQILHADWSSEAT